MTRTIFGQCSRWEARRNVEASILECGKGFIDNDYHAALFSAGCRFTPWSAATTEQPPLVGLTGHRPAATNSRDGCVNVIQARLSALAQLAGQMPPSCPRCKSADWSGQMRFASRRYGGDGHPRIRPYEGLAELWDHYGAARLDYAAYLHRLAAAGLVSLSY